MPTILSPTMQLTDEQVDLVLNEVLEKYGYDFSNYSRASLQRRLLRLISLDKFASFAEFRYRLLSDADYLNRFISQITVNVTEMFRDTAAYKTIRNDILPLLATKPFIRVWHAGCSTGEEVYSMAIMLREANLLHKSLLYATDINPVVLENVRSGIFPLNAMKQYSENYIRAGGLKDFSSYYTAFYDSVKFDEQLAKRMVLATHNLVSDRSFNEFQLILCRNVMIYFDKDLQDRALILFDESLESSGFLVLGAKETLKFSSIAGRYQQHESKHKMWQKLR
jgi:chemotaxis protein methyltransferase CheR